MYRPYEIHTFDQQRPVCTPTSFQQGFNVDLPTGEASDDSPEMTDNSDRDRTDDSDR
jgi:hypothetical protein